MENFKKITRNIIGFFIIAIFLSIIYQSIPTKEELSGREKNKTFAEIEINRLAVEVNAKVKSMEHWRSFGTSVAYLVNLELSECISYEQWRTVLKRSGYEIMLVVPESRSFWKDGIRGSIQPIQNNYCYDDLWLDLVFSRYD